MFTDLIQVGIEAIPFYGWPVTVREDRNPWPQGQARDTLRLIYPPPQPPYPLLNTNIYIPL
jgi:hypothetical protein